MLKLEGLHCAAWLLSEEFEDPKIERKIQIGGAAVAVAVPPDA